jgi:hypothetical protein
MTRATLSRQKWSSDMHGWLRSLLLSLCLLPLWASAEEVIEDFDVTLQVQPDGNLLVTERITVQAEGEQIKRGIYRDLPVTYSLPLGLLQSSPITLLGASRDGQAERVRVEQNGSWVRYYLGSADQLLQPGRYQYGLNGSCCTTRIRMSCTGTSPAISGCSRFFGPRLRSSCLPVHG